ncbi:MAG: hypothetical protein OER77_03095 [Myxococcales bacterium]|nr:hypothetical protein [Myxococcales bacterium]
MAERASHCAGASRSTMALTGARFGAVSAFQWSDIDEGACVTWIGGPQ